jgi:serine/threonine protein kinase
MPLKKTAATLLKPNQLTLDKLNEIIGKGSLGVVKKGFYRGEAVVIKSLTFKENVQLDPLASAEKFIKEARALGEIRHPTLIELKGIVLGSMSIVFEFVPLGSLKDLIRRASDSEEKDSFKWRDRYQIIADMAEGMRYLHSLKRQGDGKLLGEGFFLSFHISSFLAHTNNPDRFSLN